ncbi:MAG: hypothetical protein ACREJN_01020 [Nitrospiraceae bacterium]
MLQTDFRGLTLELAVIEELAQAGTCTFDELTERLSSYSWYEVFALVDRLSREGTLILERPRASGYIISLAPQRVNSPRYAA